MAKADYSLEDMEMIAANEELLADLYACYAGVFAEEAEFWRHLAAEEREHALWVRRLEDNIRSGAVPLQVRRINPQIYLDFAVYLQQLIHEAQTAPPSLFPALTLARDIEKTLLERPFFEIFASDTDGVKRLLRTLHESTERHYQELSAVWEAHRPRKVKGG